MNEHNGPETLENFGQLGLVILPAPSLKIKRHQLMQKKRLPGGER